MKRLLLLVVVVAACEKDDLSRSRSVIDVTIEGLGHVTEEVPSGTECAESCRLEHEATTNVTLAAVPEAGWEFASWGGECADAEGATCSFQLGGSVDVVATFTPVHPERVQLNVDVTGPGSVASTPAGIACPGTCTFAFLWETEVSLQATPDDGGTFLGWDLACTGDAGCVVEMNVEAVVRARFE